MLIGHILLFKLKDRKVAQSVAALGRPRGLTFSLISSGFGETMVKCGVGTSPVLHPPLATPAWFNAFCSQWCQKSQKLSDVHVNLHLSAWIRRYLDEMQKKDPYQLQTKTFDLKEDFTICFISRLQCIFPFFFIRRGEWPYGLSYGLKSIHVCRGSYSWHTNREFHLLITLYRRGTSF